ncbi:MAG: energy transducer TonB [Polaromonas sp.]|nr:energy transducer TonB [Polaromonas sp.]
MRIPVNRNIVIATGVIVFHVAALWALQNGLSRRTVEVIVPVALLSRTMISPPISPPPRAAPIHQPTPKRPARRPTPRPSAVADPTPAPNAPTAVLEPQAPAPPGAAPGAAAPAPPDAEQPASNADYLQNPKPAYPPISRRLGEQGKVVVRVLIGTDGAAQNAEIRQSSGFERLDQAALRTALKWRYVPGKRNGAPEAMWFNVPINFVLE